MAGKWFYSKTRWRTQRRDAMGRWTSGGTKVAKRVSAKAMSTKGGRAASKVATKTAAFAGDHVSAGFNPYQTSAHVTVTGGKQIKYLPSHKLNLSLSLSIDPIGKSIFEQKLDQAGESLATGVGKATKSNSAADAVRSAMGKRQTIQFMGTTLSSNARRRKGTTFRTTTPKQRERAQRRVNRERQREERAATRTTPAQKNGTPSTISGPKGRAQRRNKQGQPSTARRKTASTHNTLLNERKMKPSKVQSRVVKSSGNAGYYAPKKTKKKSGGTYTR